MPSTYQFKPAFQAALRPLTAQLASRGVSANAVTLTSAAASLALGAAIALWPESAWPLVALPLFLLARMALNAIDGLLAREHGMKSRAGAILNELGDVLSDAALYLPLALVPAFSAPWVVVVVVLAAIAEMTGVIGASLGASRRYDGPMGKSDRALVFGALSLWIGLGGASGAWIDAALATAALLATLTIARRAAGALREVD